MMTRPRHLHLVHSRDEPETGWNWALIVAVVLCLLFWTAVIAGVVWALAHFGMPRTWA
jgi:hypothetical protein